MGNAFDLEIKPYKDKHRPAWKWSISVSAKKTGGKRVKELFKTKDEAREWKSSFEDNAKRSGVAAALSDSITVKKAWDEFYEAKKSDAGDREKETLILNGKRICGAFGSQMFEHITIRQVEKWLSSNKWSKRTQFNAFSYLSTFIEWCRVRKMISANPIEGFTVERPSSPKPVMTPLEMRVALHCTKRDKIFRTFICCGGFAGLRTKEQQQMSWGLPEFNFADEEIWVSPEAIKNTGEQGAQERYVRMIPAFLRNVPRDLKGKIIPYSKKQFHTRREKLAMRIHRILKRINSPKASRWVRKRDGQRDVGAWPQNILRHSFLSHMLAAKKNAWEVAHEGGHRTTKTLYQDYVLPKSDREANAYLDL